jgi:hypothetical protein
MKALRFFVVICALACARSAFAQVPRNSFSVVLLVGDTAGPASIDNLPPAPGIRKALNDVKDFLPYKSYRVLDTRWLRSRMTRMRESTIKAKSLSKPVVPARHSHGMPASGKPPVIILTFAPETGAATAGEYAVDAGCRDREAACRSSGEHGWLAG